MKKRTPLLLFAGHQVLPTSRTKSPLHYTIVTKVTLPPDLTKEKHGAPCSLDSKNRTTTRHPPLHAVKAKLPLNGAAATHRFITPLTPRTE